MWTALVLVLAGAPAGPEQAERKPDGPAAKRELFAAEQWYKDQKGKEQEFVGVLERVPGPGPGVVGFGRFNPFRLVMTADGKKTVREVYVGGKPEVLAAYAGKKVKLIGKAVDFENLEGRDHHEIWPARLELLAGGEENKEDEKKPGAEGSKELKVIARGFWRASVKVGMPQQWVIRSGEELALASGLPPAKAKDADVQKDVTEAVAKLLKAEGIDWKTQMLIAATGGARRTGGYRVEITGLPVEGKTLTVRWKLHTPRPGQPVTQAFTHPAEAVLVERFDGEVKFDPPAPKEGKE